jgi:hypothetical protein
MKYKYQLFCYAVETGCLALALFRLYVSTVGGSHITPPPTEMVAQMLK